MARGLSNEELTASLIVSLATVKTHVNRIFTKLQLHSRAQAVVTAYESGLVRPGTPSSRASPGQSLTRPCPHRRAAR